MLRDGASRAPKPLYQLGYICDQPYFLIVVWTQRCSPTCFHIGGPYRGTSHNSQSLLNSALILVLKHDESLSNILTETPIIAQSNIPASQVQRGFYNIKLLWLA